MHMHTSHTLDADSEVETSCYRALCDFALMTKFLDYIPYPDLNASLSITLVGEHSSAARPLWFRGRSTPP